MLYRISAGLLLLATLGHTFGGMLGTARRGPNAGPDVDRVIGEMKAVRFRWQGAETTWFRFWLGNGLCVSAALLVPIVALWVLGGLDAAQRGTALPVAWAVVASMALTSWLGFKYFGARPGVGFGVIALLTAIATIVSI